MGRREHLCDERFGPLAAAGADTPRTDPKIIVLGHLHPQTLKELSKNICLPGAEGCQADNTLQVRK
jgi:hypothetical protein